MPLALAPGLLLLLLLLASGARGALEVSVPTSQLRARLGSDVLLGCHFSVGGPVDLRSLVVQWKLGPRLVAEFDEVLSYPRAGANLSLEGLRLGSASLLLPRVEVADAGPYTCMVIVPPSRESRQVELRLEASLTWPQVLGIIAGVLIALLLPWLSWLMYQCCSRRMSSIRVWECIPEGRVTALCCEVQGWLSDGDTLTWFKGKERGPGQDKELNRLLPKQHYVDTWRVPLGLGRQQLTSVLTLPTPSGKETFSCTFRTQQKFVTIPRVPADSPDGDLSSL